MSLSASTKGLPIDIPTLTTPVDVHVCPAGYTDEVLLVINAYGLGAIATIEFDDGVTQTTQKLNIATKENGVALRFTISDGVTISVESTVSAALNVAGSVTRTAYYA
jgi:hypothetical protein